MQMASGAFANRLDPGVIVGAMGSFSLRELLTFLLSADSAVHHLAALSLYQGGTAGVRELKYDPETLRGVRNEYMGRALAANASLHQEHVQLLHGLLRAEYVNKVGSTMAKLVQRRVLFDVVAKDFSSVAGNALRAPEVEVVALLRALEGSRFDEIRSEARRVREAFISMHDSGEQMAGVPLANAKHMQALVDLFDEM